MLIARVPRPRAHLLLVALVLALFPLVAPTAPARADYSVLCSGYVGCKDAGYGNAGYQQNNGTMYWRMYSGHNCTNYAAYRMVKAGMPNTRPWSGGGNAENWGHAMAFLTDDTPRVGAVAWYDQYAGYAGSAGHVAYVERVISNNEIVISEDMWGGDFHWRRITRSGRGWPSGFIHFRDVALKSTKAPTVTGVAQVGQTLSATTGTWSSTPSSYTYQWFADGVAIKDATNPTLTLGPGKVGQQISVQVAASATGYAPAIATSAATADVAPGVITTVTAPAITGEPLVGQTLTASRGTYDPGSTTKTVQWLSDGQPIAGATSWSLTLTPAQAGTNVRALVSVSRTGYEPTSARSAATDSVLGGEIHVTSPFTLTTATPTPRVGEPVQVVPGTVDPADAEVAYAWLRDGVEIPGATGPAYVPGADDVGHRLSVRADLTRQGYKSATQTTEPTVPVHTVPHLDVTVLGKPDRARVTVSVTAPGVPLVRGRITVYVGGHTVEVGLVEGKRTVVVPDQRAGNRKVVVRYLGRGLVDPGFFRGTVLIPKAG